MGLFVAARDPDQFPAHGRLGFGGFATFEREPIAGRTMAGLATAWTAVTHDRFSVGVRDNGR